MTKKRLSRMRYLKAEINRLENRISELDDKIIQCTAIITDMPKGNVAHDRMAEYVAQKDKLERIITRRMREWNRLWGYICDIPDSRTRTIFELRYKDGLTWDSIADETSYSERQIRRIHNQYLDH